MILRLPPGGWKINKDPTFMTADIVHGCVVSSIHYPRRCESATSSWCCAPRMRGRGESKQLLSKTHGSTAAVWRLICRCMSWALLQFAFRKYVACILGLFNFGIYTNWINTQLLPSHSWLNPLALSQIINLFLEIFTDFNFTQTSCLRIDVEHLACLLWILCIHHILSISVKIEELYIPQIGNVCLCAYLTFGDNCS